MKLIPRFKGLEVVITLREKCPYSEFFWSIFSRIRTEYGEIQSISPYPVRMRENTDQKNSEYGHFSRSVSLKVQVCKMKTKNYAMQNDTHDNISVKSKFKNNVSIHE